jgi:ABC-2 type transport system permease protein
LPSHSRPFIWLLAKEWRQLVLSRSWWALLLAMGPLVGICFIAAVRSYADVSGLGGTSAGVGVALWPMIGVWAPTFSACELAAVFLLPFVAIRMVGADRQNGALKLELQRGMNTGSLVTAKATIAGVGWLIAMLPAISAIPLWKWYGGAVYPPEMFALISGHILNAGLTIALGAAAGAVAEHPSTAAILTLGVTVGTWIVNFFGAIQGGFWERAAEYTPAAMVAGFQHALVRMDTVLVAAVLMLAGLALTAVWMRLGEAPIRRFGKSIAIVVLAAGAILACTAIHATWDVSENRYNSFPESDERALRQIHQPLRIEVHLAPEDPRRVDLERIALAKLRRALPKLQVDYVAATTTGLFEQTRSGYGEIWYSLGSRKIMSRITTEEGVLESIYSIAAIQPPAENDETIFRGHPLTARPRGAAALFFFVWPTLILIAGIRVRRSFV